MTRRFKFTVVVTIESRSDAFHVKPPSIVLAEVIQTALEQVVNDLGTVLVYGVELK